MKLLIRLQNLYIWSEGIIIEDYFNDAQMKNMKQNRNKKIQSHLRISRI